MLDRRNLIGGLLAAPAIVRFESLMPVRALQPWTLRSGLNGFTEEELRYFRMQLSNKAGDNRGWFNLHKNCQQCAEFLIRHELSPFRFGPS